MSLVPLLFSDWWQDLERPHRYLPSLNWNYLRVNVINSNVKYFVVLASWIRSLVVVFDLTSWWDQIFWTTTMSYPVTEDSIHLDPTTDQTMFLNSCVRWKEVAPLLWKQTRTSSKCKWFFTVFLNISLLL